MKICAFIPLISVLAAVLAFSGRDMVWAPEVKAQNAPAPKKTPAAPPTQSADVNERIARLEQRILDMQGVIATLQTFVKGGGGAPGGLPQANGQQDGGSASGAPSEVNIRVLALETQIRALTGQMEQMSERLNQLPAGAGSGALPPLPGDQSGTDPRLGPPTAGQTEKFASSARPAPQFGTTTAPPPENPFEKIMRSGSAPQAPPAPREQAQLPSLPGLSGAGGSARGIYDASYQNFLRNDLPAAEQGFNAFVKSHPDDPLISNAYYWLGRTHFQRKNFEPAAKAFLAGYKKDKNSAIAPDALLHLGMSLAQLGEKDAACSTLSAIAKQFPDAPDKLKQDAASALKRTRC